MMCKILIILFVSFSLNNLIESRKLEIPNKQIKKFTYDLDNELGEAIEYSTPEFAVSLKRRFRNAGISEEIRSSIPSLPAITFTDIYIKDESNQITLKNLCIEKHPIARLNDINPNLYEKNIKISADWYNIVIKGSYETSNSNQLKLLPVKNCGRIEIKIENIATTGLVGFQIFRDALKTTNFDLNFNSENVTIDIEYFDSYTKNSTKSSQNFFNIDKSIAKYIKKDLYWKLKDTLRNRLDYVLQDFTLTEIFNENNEISSKYVARSHSLDNILNKIIDQFLIDIKSNIISNGYDKIAIPDFSTDFSHKFGVVTFWGSFQAVNGTISDLSTLKRTGKFSFLSTPKSTEVTIFGSIGLNELLLNYDSYYAQIWNIGPRGDMKALVGSNSIDLKLLVDIKDWLEFDIDIKDVSVRVQQLENIKVEATGMSIFLNWLLSYISTWMTGVFKTQIISMIEENLKELLTNYSSKIRFSKNSF